MSNGQFPYIASPAQIQEFPFPKPLEKSVMACVAYAQYPSYEWKQAPQDSTITYALTSLNQDIAWRQVTLPAGINFGDLLQWDPEVGDEGAWIVLERPEDEERFLYWDGSMWQYAETKEFVICEDGEPVTYKIPIIPVS
jgi:hypothetical protein